MLRRCGIAHLVDRLGRIERRDRLHRAGELQRLGLARALMRAPDLLMLDGAWASFEAAEAGARTAAIGEALGGDPPPRPEGRSGPGLRPCRPAGAARPGGRGYAARRRRRRARQRFHTAASRQGHRASLAIYEKLWDSDPTVCPCDQHLLDWIAAEDERGAGIFRFGTGNHHLVGIRSAEDGRGNAVLGITAAPREHESYVRLVIERPEGGPRL